MKQIKQITIPAWKLAEWNELTECNAHGKRLERIADYMQGFADDEGRAELYAVACMLNALNCQHERLGHLPIWLYEIRRSLRARLWVVIYENFGRETLKQINL